MNSKIIELIGDLIQQQKTEVGGNNLLAVISLITLLKIVDLPQNQIENLSSPDLKSDSSADNTVGKLLNQFSGQGENNLQQLLPLLLQSLQQNDINNSPSTREESNQQTGKSKKENDDQKKKKKII